MKKLFVYFCLLISLVSCGSANKSTLGVLKEKSRAQQFAEDINRTTMRAWAQYTGFAHMNLEAYAAAAARALLAEQTSVLICRTIDIRSESLGTSEIKSIAEETIKGSRVVMSDRYVQRNGSETCHVAVEISIDDIVRNIRHSEMIQEALSKAAGGRVVDFDDTDFAETMTESFNNIKKESNFLDVSFLP